MVLSSVVACSRSVVPKVVSVLHNERQSLGDGAEYSGSPSAVRALMARALMDIS